MPLYTRRVLVGGAASVCIALVGVAMVWNTLRHQPEVTALKPVAAVPAATESPARLESDESAAASSPDVASEARGSQPQVQMQAPAQVAAENREDGATKGKSTRGAEPLAAPVAGEQKLDEGYSIAVADALTSTPVAQPPAAAAPADALPANGQPAAASPAPAPVNATDEQLESVAVTGQRGSLKSSRESKREATVQVEAEEIMVTGARSSRTRAPPHKGMTGSPRQSGGTLGGTSAAILVAPTELPPPAGVAGRDKFEQFEVNSVKQVVRRAGVHVLGGCRHLLVQLRAQAARSRCVAAEGCRARRGDDQLLRLRAGPRRNRASGRSSPRWWSVTRPGARAAS